jgi:hypothetical protein
LAFTKQHKQELVATYEKWLKDSKAVYVLSYQNMAMKDIDALRSDARDLGGELHVVKNTLMNIALKNSGFEDVGLFDKSSLVAFAFSDAASVAKVADKASASKYTRSQANLTAPCECRFSDNAGKTARPAPDARPVPGSPADACDTVRSHAYGTRPASCRGCQSVFRKKPGTRRWLKLILTNHF